MQGTLLEKIGTGMAALRIWGLMSGGGGDHAGRICRLALAAHCAFGEREVFVSRQRACEHQKLLRYHLCPDRGGSKSLLRNEHCQEVFVWTARCLRSSWIHNSLW